MLVFEEERVKFQHDLLFLFLNAVLFEKIVMITT